MVTTTKFQSFVLSVTTLIVFSAWFKLNSFVIINPYVKIVITSLISLGLYQLVASFFLFLFGHIRIIRKFFLGAKYIEGTWIGFYIGLSGKVRFIIEHFEQDFETTIVRGTSYNDLSQFHNSWISYPANTDVSKGELTYMYELKGIQDKSIGTGIAFFSLTRENQSSAPTMIKGFSADLHNNGIRTRSLEYKLSDSNNFSDSECLKKAIKFYAANKDIF